MYDFCAKDNLRPALTGVYHKNGYKYATDAFILCKMKQDYAPELEGHVVLRDGSILSKDRYASVSNYDAVLPRKLDDYVSVKIDFAQLQQWGKEAKLHKKTYGKDSVQLVYVYQDHSFRIEYLIRVAAAMKELGTTELHVHKTMRTRPAVVRTEGATIIIMPYLYDEDDEDEEGRDDIMIKRLTI